MRILDGLEMTCFTKSRHFELEYRGQGVYAEPRGDVVNDLQDLACMSCSSSFYTRHGDPIAFCPACGAFERKRFSEDKELSDFLRGQDFTWLGRVGFKPFAVKTQQNTWELKFSRDALSLEASGAWRQVKPL
jgi:hypothetical protein